MTGNQVLQIISCGNVLGFRRAQEVLLDGICVVAEGDLDWALKSVNIAVVAGTLHVGLAIVLYVVDCILVHLVSLMLLH